MDLSLPSKYPNLSFIEQEINNFEQLPHTHCQCIHCVNNTKPLLQSKAPRIISNKEKVLKDSQAYIDILRKLAQFQFFGKIKTPDVFIVQEGTLIYTSKTIDKIKKKQNQNSIQVKRYFDDHRRKIQSSADVYNNNSFLTQNTNNLVPKNMKEIALLVYKDGTEQLLTQIYLSRTLQKRKNDPFWDQVSHIMQIPPQVKSPIQKFSFHYERTSQTLLQLTPILQKISEELDNLLENFDTNRSERFGFLGLEHSEINPQNKIGKNTSLRLSKLDSVLFYNFIPRNRQEIEDDIKICIYQIVAFLEISSCTRILNGIFECFLDDKGRFYLSNIRNCILESLDESERLMIHDRYKPLQEIQLEQISKQKIYYDRIQQEQLWKICSAIMNQCLQLRKVELKLAEYKKPNHTTLLSIFMKVFPEFKPESIFANKNWKNDLNVFIQDIRQKINKIIREDQGIRILRRFNIQFRRTFK